MEEWQIKHIRANLSWLIKLIRCSTLLIASLKGNRVLNDEECENVEKLPTEASKSKLLLEVLETRKDAYWFLLHSLAETNQSGAIKILTDESIRSDALKELLSFNIAWMHSTCSLQNLLKNASPTFLEDFLESSFDVEKMRDYEWIWLQKGAENPRTPMSPNISKECPDYYKPRKLVIQRKLSPEVFKKACTDVFIFIGVSRPILSDLLRGTGFSTDYLYSWIQSKTILCRHLICACLNELESIEDTHERNLHIIRYKDSSYYWEHSYGNTEVFQGYVCRETYEEVSQNEVIRSFTFSGLSSCICITDTSGAGKSKLLKGFKQYLMEKNKIVINIDCAALAKQSKHVLSDEDSALDYIKSIAFVEYNFDGPLQTQIATYKILSSQEKLFLVVDGLDELKDKNLELCIDRLLTLRKHKRIRLIVAMRPDEQVSFETRYGVFPYCLKAFDHEEQESFLTGYWKIKGVDSSDYVVSLAKICVGRLQKTIATNSPGVAGTALLCNLYAQISEKHAKLGQTLGQNFVPYIDFGVSISDTYDKLMELKLADLEPRLASEYINSNCIRTSIAHDLMRAAARQYIPIGKEDCSYHLTDHKIHEFQKVGLFKSDKIDHSFMHQSYGDYWLGKYIADHITTKQADKIFESSDICKYIIQNVFSVDVRQRQILKFPKQDGECVKTCSFKNRSLTYFINFHLKDDTHTNQLSIQYCENVKDHIWDILTACIVDNRQNIFQSLGMFQAVLKTMKAYDKVRNALLNLASLATKHLDEITFEQFWMHIKHFGNENNERILQFFAMHPGSDRKTSTLEIAVECGKYKIVEMLMIGYGPKELEKLNLLHICVRDTIASDGNKIKSKENIINFLVDVCPDLLHLCLPKDKSTAILQPRIHLKLLKILIDKVPNLNVRTYDGDSLLHRPLIRELQKPTMDLSDFTKLVQILLRKNNSLGFNEDDREPFEHFVAQNSEGKTPLHLAVECMDIDEVLLNTFVSAKLDVSARDNMGENILFVALRCQRSLRCVKAIYEVCSQGLGAQKNFKGQTIWHLAAEFSSPVILKYLLGSSSDQCLSLVENKDYDGDTPLHIAVRRQTTDTNELQDILLEKGVGLNVENGIGDIPLVHSLRSGNSLDTSLRLMSVMNKKEMMHGDIASKCINVLLLNMSIVASSDPKKFHKTLQTLVDSNGDFRCNQGDDESIWQQQTIKEVIEKLCETKPGLLVKLSSILNNMNLKSYQDFLKNAEDQKIGLSRLCLYLLEIDYLTVFCTIRQRLRELSFSNLTYRTPPDYLLKYLRHGNEKTLTICVRDVSYYIRRLRETIGGSLYIYKGPNQKTPVGRADIGVIKVGDNESLFGDNDSFDTHARLVLQVTTLSSVPTDGKKFVDDLSWSDLTNRCRSLIKSKLMTYIVSKHEEALEKLTSTSIESIADSLNMNAEIFLSREAMKVRNVKDTTLTWKYLTPTLQANIKLAVEKFFCNRYFKALMNADCGAVLTMLSKAKFDNVVLRTLIKASVDNDAWKSVLEKRMSANELFNTAFGDPENFRTNLLESVVKSKLKPGDSTSFIIIIDLYCRFLIFLQITRHPYV